MPSMLVYLSKLIYVGAMAMGSLTRYRRLIMGIGLVIFLGGAVARWHRNRNLGVVATTPAVGAKKGQSWEQECLTYACKVLSVPDGECESMCKQATEAGTPRTLAERMAFACDKYCTAEGAGEANCRSSCLVREAKSSATSR
ncbi:MAG: hypothetical protein JKY56_27910 [Kofleriaceae bacterium]|nr:hypothetical protein [Kofleriaceae bacterium]